MTYGEAVEMLLERSDIQARDIQKIIRLTEGLIKIMNELSWRNRTLEQQMYEIFLLIGMAPKVSLLEH